MLPSCVFPYPFCSFFCNWAVSNYTHFFSDEFDALYEAAMKEVSSQKRIGFYRKMNNIIMQEAAVVPLYYDQVVRFVQNNIDGLPSNAMNLLELKTVSKTKFN